MSTEPTPTQPAPSRQTVADIPVGVILLAVLNIIVGLFSVFTGVTIDFILIGGELTLVSSIQLGAVLIVF
jgi:hypothetical protein